MKILFILLHILNLFMNLLCIHCSVEIQNMLMNSKWICPMIILALVCHEDCCDGQGQLHICCGEFNMDMVVLHWISMHSHLIWWLKSWIGLKQNLKSYCGFGYFILTWNTQNTKWLTHPIQSFITYIAWALNLHIGLFSRPANLGRRTQISCRPSIDKV